MAVYRHGNPGDRFVELDGMNGTGQELLAGLLKYWPELAALFGVLLALLVTAHVVMHKRDARAAAAWTGLVWLVPILGALLYFVLGVNRIQRRARQLTPSYPDTPVYGEVPVVQPRPQPLHLHTLAELTYRLTELPLTTGNHLVPMEAPQALEQMIAAIDQAETSVFLSTYIFGNDGAGRPMVEALARAVRRGVRVRVLVDGMGSLYSFPTVIRRLRKRGIVVERFLYSLAPWRMSYMNLRNHRKIMVVDQAIGFTGGMNLRAAYITEPPGIRDIHARVEGPVVAHLLRSFVADWYFSCGEYLNDRYEGPVECGSMLARGVNAGPDMDLGKRRLVLLAALGRAQHEVRIVTPYFVPDETLLTALQIACMRGVRVELMLPAHNNLPFVHWASLHMLPWLVAEGCEVWFSAEPFDHGKIMTVDGVWSMVGSGNWDARSLRLNFEFDVEGYDQQLAEQLNGMIDMRRANARRISLEDLRRQSYPRRLRNAFAHILEPYL